MTDPVPIDPAAAAAATAAGGGPPVPTTAAFAARLAQIAGVTPVPSPCVDICRIDSTRGTCAGCRRTLDEIAAWGGLDDAGKRAIWARLPGRGAVRA